MSWYGQIHVAVRELVLEKFGEDNWKRILQKADLDDNEHFMVFHRYTDSVTFKLIGAVSEILGVPVTGVLEVFGEYFFQYCLKHGYDKMLKSLGEDLTSFVQNLDSLHSMLAMSYKNIEAPSFRCETNEDGTLILHYYTVRPGLYPIVIGLVRAVGRDLFNTNAILEVINISSQQLTEKDVQEHVSFKVTLVDKNKNTSKSAKVVYQHSGEMKVYSRDAFTPTIPSNLQISAKNFCLVFPYHVIFDKDLSVKQSGIMIQKLCPTLSEENTFMEKCFNLVHPRMKFTFSNILTFINANFVLEIKLKGLANDSSIKVKGQMVWLEDVDHMIYICSPRLASLTELMEKNVFLSDIPIYDVTRELVLLNQQRIAEIEISKKLDETTAELRKTSRALEAEKQKTDMLLYQMLPVKAADQLREGKPVEAEKFEDVTILFSDIVTFTNIAAACAPLQIVSMLNSLYHRFDSLTNTHDVYKVETIGDAYMVVSGAPEISETHAQKVSNFAMDMVEDAANVSSPATGLPIQIRVGIHTGPIVAGVVGLKMPRYCLFGDTVNTASRMESHGVPGRIHVSPFTYNKIQGGNYLFRTRGDTEIKGKGTMHTYFLIGRNDRHMKEPDDEFTDEGDYPTIKVSHSGENATTAEEELTRSSSLTTQSPTIKIPDVTSDKPITSTTCIVL
ncbi:guanylate cyclase soluble subunit beta-2-like [Liolophura sinensis]|uniref:guanylate cyclase soluble subunit beta-2-like n=1 Tax=Liolophura sinensis TaxID=3198878 RepID=UPI0031580F7B